MNRLPNELERFLVNKKPLQERIAAQNAASGIPTQPSLSLEEFRAQLLASGINPEDNLLSCGIISAREE